LSNQIESENRAVQQPQSLAKDSAANGILTA
jgi:hypothetical protein